MKPERNRSGSIPHGEPLTDEEAAIFQTAVRHNFYQNSGWPNLTLANEKPGAGFWLKSLDGNIKFSIHPAEGARKIEPGKLVQAKTIESSIDGITQKEFVIIGATEGVHNPETDDPEVEIGIIRQYSDLLVRPVTTTPLLPMDRFMTPDNFQTEVEQGRIVKHKVKGKAGWLRRVLHEPVIIPNVEQLVRAQPRRNQDPNVFSFVE